MRWMKLQTLSAIIGRIPHTWNPWISNDIVAFENLNRLCAQQSMNRLDVQIQCVSQAHAREDMIKRLIFSGVKTFSHRPNISPKFDFIVFKKFGDMKKLDRCRISQVILWKTVAQLLSRIICKAGQWRGETWIWLTHTHTLSVPSFRTRIHARARALSWWAGERGKGHLMTSHKICA